jgi:hypothetical protein
MLAARHAASVRVWADFFLGCGERLFAQQTVRRLEQIREKLKDCGAHNDYN